MQTIDTPIYPLYPPPARSDFVGEIPVLNEDGTVDREMLKVELLLAHIHSDFIDDYADITIKNGSIDISGIYYELTRKTGGAPPLLHEHVGVLFRVTEEFVARNGGISICVKVGDIEIRPMPLCEVANGARFDDAEMALAHNIRGVPHKRYCPQCYDETPVAPSDVLVYRIDMRSWITPKPLPANAVCVE